MFTPHWRQVPAALYMGVSQAKGSRWMKGITPLGLGERRKREKRGLDEKKQVTTTKVLGWCKCNGRFHHYFQWQNP